MKTCPFCKESVQPGATICPHCRKRQPNWLRELVKVAIFIGIVWAIWDWGVRPFTEVASTLQRKESIRAERLQTLRSKTSPQMRKEFAARAEDLFLDHSVNAEFVTSGKEQTVLTMKIPYVSRLEVHTLNKGLDWETIGALGFRKVTCTDGQRSASWDVP